MLKKRLIVTKVRSKIKLFRLDSELEQAIAAAKSEGEKLVDSSVAEATKKSQALKHRKTIDEAKSKSKEYCIRNNGTKCTRHCQHFTKRSRVELFKPVQYG